MTAPSLPSITSIGLIIKMAFMLTWYRGNRFLVLAINLIGYGMAKFYKANRTQQYPTKRRCFSWDALALRLAAVMQVHILVTSFKMGHSRLAFGIA